jgi:hypothetical protein
MISLTVERLGNDPIEAREESTGELALSSAPYGGG